jgi:spore coat protein A
MISRREFLKFTGAAGAGAFLASKSKILPAFAEAETNIDPLYSAPILDPAAIPQFINPLPVIKDLGLRKDLTAGGAVNIAMGSTTQSLLGPGMPATPVWGYKIDSGPITYPGGTIVAKRGKPVTVNWANNLGYDYLIKQGNPDDGDVIDRTLHWAFSSHLTPEPYTIGSQGVPAVAHQHGGRTDSNYDGLPEQWFTPSGATGNYYYSDTYIYDLDQEAATLWYHDHALGITRLNVYAGLAGFWFLRDDNEEYLINNNMIPSGDFETEIVIQDRMFWPDGRLAYPDVPWDSDDWVGGPSHQPEFFGQVILVNGKAWPFYNVEPRQYRFRLLNGSDSRFYNLFFNTGDTADPMIPNGPTIWVIGDDTGLLNTPVPVQQLTIGPGERYDVVVDFSGTLDGLSPGFWDGQTLAVRNTGRSPFPKGDTVNPQLDGRIMVFRVVLPTSGGAIAPLTATTDLRPVSGPIPALTATAPNRRLMLFEATDHFGRLQPLLGTIDPNPPTGTPTDGTFLWDDPITENPGLDDTEIWEVHNATEDAHPIHLHLVKFQILNRQKYSADIVPKDNPAPDGTVTIGGALRNVKYKGQPKGPDAYEAGWKDTAIMYPGEVTRIIAKFDKPGRYVWHCHILSHEDHEMMRPYFVGQMP